MGKGIPAKGSKSKRPRPERMGDGNLRRVILSDMGTCWEGVGGAREGKVRPVVGPEF